MRSARAALVAVLAASCLLVAAPARARHTCNLPDETLDRICESHGLTLEELLCLILPTLPICSPPG